MTELEKMIAVLAVIILICMVYIAINVVYEDRKNGNNKKPI